MREIEILVAQVQGIVKLDREIGDNDQDKQIKEIFELVKTKAREDFREGTYQTPEKIREKYCLEFSLEAGISEFYAEEIERLLLEKICPCCGQTTRGDIDW